MTTAATHAAARWRRLLLPGLLALGVHLTLLWLIDPQAEPAGTTTILRPLIYNTAPPMVAQPPQAPAPATRARRPPRPQPAPAVAPGPAVVESEPLPAPPVAAPVDAAAPTETAPAQQVAASAPPPPPVPTAPQVALPGSLRLKYTLYGELSRLPYHASGELLWTHDGRDYEARMEIGAFLLGSRVQSSRGRLTPTGLQPLRFLDKVRTDRTVDFDHAHGQARFSEGAPPAALQAGAQDQLSVFMQLGSQIGAEPQRYPPGTELTVQAVGVYGDETWRFVVGAEERLQLPGGEVSALKLTRKPLRADEPRAELWLAPALGWLPARIRLTQDNGDFIDQQWRASEAP